MPSAYLIDSGLRNKAGDLSLEKIMINLKSIFFAGLLTCGFGQSNLFAQCDSAIFSAFKAGLDRTPTSTECNSNRYAPFASKLYSKYATAAYLVDFVKASVVCSDPWVAQVFYLQGRPLNLHDARDLERGGPGSSTDQCNYTYYFTPTVKGWNSFDEFFDIVNAHFNGAPRAPTTSLVSLNVAGSIPNGSQVTLQWSYSGNPPTCSGGFYLSLAGSIFGPDYRMGSTIPNLGAKSFTFKMPDLSSQLRSDTPITMTLKNLCTSTAASNSVTPTIVMPGVQVSAAGQIVRLNLKGALVTTTGQLVDANGALLKDSSHSYYLDQNLVLKVADLVSTNGGNVVAQGGGNVVAAGGGNVVAAGGGNVIAAGTAAVVAAGGGNVVAAGGGNVIAQGGGNVVAIPNYNLRVASDRVVAGFNSGFLIDKWGAAILHAGSGASFSHSLLVDYKNAAVVSPDGATFVMDGGAFKLVNLTAAQQQQLLNGSSLAQILSPGNITPQLNGIDPGRLMSQISNIRSLMSVNGISLAAPTAWPNNSAAQFNWGFPGNTAVKSIVIQIQLASKGYDVCTAAVSASSCTTQKLNWRAAIATNTQATVVLLDAATRATLASKTITINAQ